MHQWLKVLKRRNQGLEFSIQINMSPKKELLWGLWVALNPEPIGLRFRVGGALLEDQCFGSFVC